MYELSFRDGYLYGKAKNSSFCLLVWLDKEVLWRILTNECQNIVYDFGSNNALNQLLGQILFVDLLLLD